MAQVLAIIIAAAMVLSIIAPFLGAMAYGGQPSIVTAAVPASSKEAQAGKSGITVNAEIGFEQKYVMNQITPVQILLENNGTDFTGEIQIKAYVQKNYNNTAGEYILFYQPLELKSGAKKLVNMEFTISVINSDIHILLVDEKGNIIEDKVCTADLLAPDTMLTGVLTENRDDLSYLQGLQLPGSSAEYQTVFLDAEALPETASGLDSLSLLIIDNFDTKKLSDKQRKAILAWTEEGGMLAFGTGTNAQKVLGGFLDAFSVQIGETKELQELPEYEQIVWVEGMDTLPVTKITAEGAIAIGTEEGQALSQAIPYGAGGIIIHAYDLIFSNKTAIAISQASDFLSEIYWQAMPISTFDPDYGNIFQGVSSMPPFQGGTLKIIFCLLGLYILCMPILYFVLKKKDKREMGWKIIPILSVAITIVIFAIGKTSLYNNSMATVVSKVTIRDDSLTIPTTLSIGISSPKQGKLKIELSERLQMNLMDQRYNYSYYYNDYFEKDICYARVSSGTDKSDVTYMHRNSWEENNFTAEKTITLSGTISDSLEIKDGKLMGNITNQTGRDFEDTILYACGQYIRLGEFLQGDTKEIQKDITGISDDLYYEIAKAFGTDPHQGVWIDELVAQRKIKKEDAYYMNQEMQLLNNLSSYQQNYQNANLLPIILYTFSREPLFEEPIFINGKQAITFHHTVFQKDMSVDFTAIEDYELPFGFLKPASVSLDGNIVYDKTQYNISMESVYVDDGGYLEAILEIPVDAKEFTLLWASDSSYMPPLREKKIYNFETDSWESLSEAPYEAIQTYTDGAGQIRISAEIDSEGELILPKIYVKGGSR